MMQVLEEIPSQLTPQINAAVDWINRQRPQTFEVTGLVDYEQAVAAKHGESIQLGLVLCDGEICTREQLLIEPTKDGFQCSFVEMAEQEIPPLLDPPAGIRRTWLNSALERHEFVL
ncbi:MAG: hypothetical protein HN738_02125, partial [Gammaproteobacteria bacterium]|nr:hypothetical protein [Gammaproteobacteria bacterium]